MRYFPGIFNDVIGPVMRGPSSSHTAASWRIATLSMAILGEDLKSAIIDFDRDGAWAPNYREQGTVMGMNGGLLQLDITDDRMKNTDSLLKKNGVDVRYEVNSFETNHANTVRLKLEGVHNTKVQIIAASTGGGNFEIQQINQLKVCIKGDRYERLWLIKNPNESVLQDINETIPDDYECIIASDNDELLVNIKSQQEIPKFVIEKLKTQLDIASAIVLKPILPIQRLDKPVMPFSDMQSLKAYSISNKKTLGELGILYEKTLSGISTSGLIDKMNSIINRIDQSIKKGLQGTSYSDRILHQQSHLIDQAAKAGKIPDQRIINQIIAYVSAIMEAKSAMEVIVANPTAGSSGTVGGALKAVAEDLNSSKDELVHAYYAAGITGVFFAERIGFSAEEHACQVECGAASGMAAAGIVQLFGGTAVQAIDAASMAIQNMIGLICDPVADRVEVPCLGKNISAAVNALASATMSCAGFNSVIPYDQVLDTIEKVSQQMPACVKCTGKGGLAITPSAIEIKKNLKEN